MKPRTGKKLVVLNLAYKYILRFYIPELFITGAGFVPCASLPSLSFGAEAPEGAGDHGFPPTQQPTAPPPTPAA